MQELVETRMEISQKVTAGAKLPETMILYTIDTGHFVIAPRSSRVLEERALTKTRVSIASENDKYVIRLPAKIFDFYRLDKSDYTVMTSDKDPKTIIVTV